VAIRIKSQWHDEDAPRSPQEIGGAIAFIAWRLALDKAVSLHSRQFAYRDDNQRLSVIAEYLAYTAQVVDRLIHDRLDGETRIALITALAMKLADHYRDNATDLLGAGDHADRFIALFNERSADYAEFGFNQDGPSYPFLRHLGARIQQLMGREEHDNRWVIDQVMDVDGPELYRQLVRAVGNLLD